MTNATERAIFLQAIDEESLDDRVAYLNSACGDDVALRASVEALLDAHDRPANLLDRPIGGGQGIVSTQPAPALPPIQHIGMRIGPYRLMEQVGEGGFGLVFVAQQEHPVKRKVALKIVKPGAGSKEVIARFEAERQAVAMMNHPNIAQVFDAGVTDDHRPYFVMELVRGFPITEFCDNHQLDVRDRLNLLADVCAAVHHAHQKGVIHRDIKPSNVMVTLHDAKPVAKVIDFGVAKAIGQTLTDKTIYTRFFSMIGTPLYMSPEQAEMSGLDVDTRSDIFSLGVLMYELLVGATPFDRERLDSVGLDELRQIIREEQPPRPSRRLTTLGDEMTTVSAARRIEPARLSSMLKGDLDWIVMKALEKDRVRRYESAAAMGDDIKRYLSQQPIVARPPTWAYQFSKFARRHRTVIATFSLIAVTLLSATAVSLWQMNVAILERDQKEQALSEATDAKLKIEQFAANITRANSLVASAQTHVNAGRIDSARQDYDMALTQLPSYYQPWVARAQFFTGLQSWDEAADDYAEALSLGAPTETPSWWGTASLFLLTNHVPEYLAICGDLDRRLALPLDEPNWELLRECAASGEYEFLISWKELAELAETWLAEQDSRSFRPPPMPHRDHSNRPNMPWEVCHFITGFCHVRAGNDQRAIDRLIQASEHGRWPSDGLVDPLLAIAYHRLGNQSEAESALERSQSTIEKPPVTDRGNEPRPPGPWFDAVELRVLHAEATRLISP
ncbi:Serine/threonine-protein kinase PrkC [Rubripirellula tenax]|uniref:Serine/threonine-protein kinase PrkC n=1 Tax=Rubripirellula tenax TaxID=2528015 RepID=A0A5C6F3J5_9BACT|nr:serine/threonine-protein kinase [Rubripirellula tenax]TWU54359.1 Serine/threonine-protein kinase PrkC [Rubripirellula tenax]